MKIYLDWQDVVDITGTSRSEAYRIIAGLNEEQKKKGFRTITGKIPAKVFAERYNISFEEVKI